MDLKTKKIISKEILILLSSISISFFLFLGTYGYNIYNNYKINNISLNINTKYNESILLSSSFNYKQKKHIWYFEVLSKLFNRIRYLILED